MDKFKVITYYDSLNSIFDSTLVDYMDKENLSYILFPSRTDGEEVENLIKSILLTASVIFLPPQTARTDASRLLGANYSDIPLFSFFTDEDGDFNGFFYRQNCKVTDASLEMLSSCINDFIIKSSSSKGETTNENMEGES